MMLGDVGGLSDILILGIASLVGVFNEPLMTAELVSKLYKKKTKKQSQKDKPFKPFLPVKFKTGFLIIDALIPKSCTFLKSRRKLIRMAEKKLEKSLDVL